MSKHTGEQTLKGSVTQESKEEQIRLEAYYLWEKKGKNLWSDQNDWFEAEEYVNN